MILTILSARFANEDHSAAIIATKEAADVVVSAHDTPELWAEVLAWGTPAAYEPPARSTITSKADIFRRMTDVEAATFADVKAKQPLRLQLLFEGAAELHSNAAEWPFLVSLFEAAYGQARAAELLAPST